MAEEPGRSSLGNAGLVEEIQGLYGPVFVSELLIQRIWLRQTLVPGPWRTAEGAELQVLHPGRWNRLAGPDFREARLAINGRPVTGDVEVHFHERDWWAHGHAADPGFVGVVLHVVLFPGKGASDAGPQRVRTLRGLVPHSLVLLPLLSEDLEQLASDDALQCAGDRDGLVAMAALLALPLPERRAKLRALAAQRWAARLRFTRRRVEREGFAEAAHQLLFEILGFRRNRAPMADLALACPHGSCRLDPGVLDPEARFAERRGDWTLAGLRPANHPRRRLAQARALYDRIPDWPDRLARLRLPPWLVSDREQTPAARRRSHWSSWTETVRRDVFADTIGGTRWLTWLADGLLPLLAVREDADATEAERAAGLWFHSQPGDIPDALKVFLANSRITGDRQHPLTHGWLQGALQGFLTDAFRGD
ncbi:MAG: DUF2851 family protein [Opitutales bacterium]